MTLDIAAIKALNTAIEQSRNIKGKAVGVFPLETLKGIRAALDASEAARVKAEQERDAARGKHFKSTIHNGVSAQFLKHDAKRITAIEQERDELRRQVTYWQAQTLERSGDISALEQERDALKEALTNSCDLLESYIYTFGDMSGANRADLNDYRAVLTAYDKREQS